MTSRTRSGFLSCALPALVGVRPAAVLLFANLRRRVCDTKKTKGCFYPAGFVPVWFGCKNIVP
nr:MAG TPA: hypothetical protein [Caudoviricetes sp.]